MRIDTARFPLVWIFDDAQQEDVLPQLDALLERGEKFALIMQRNTGDDDSVSPEEKKRNALWLKHNRAVLKNCCAGAVFVVNNKALELMVRPMLLPVSKAFGIPLSIAKQADAELKARRMLE